ncbi:uncharacterized protein LOC121684081 [Alosa sapidissima]|uniref:uncharacterized protein LOC121684081 n=1 Tax=Alosa sapidissima TaxID=34773 RepID=UPI001C09DE90|nr:uncharacterized protein LOC121684081 [Alosa sapidissima]
MFKDMSKTMQITLVFIVCVCLTASISGVQNCVMTTQRVIAGQGSDVHLICNFSLCGSLNPSDRDTVEWYFQSNTSNPVDHIIDQETQPTKHWSNVRFTGDLSLGDFSILLQSVESLKHTGTYGCRLRLNGHIHKNSTKITFRMTRNILPTEHSNESSDTRSPRQLAVCCITILLFLVGGALVGKWAWHKMTLQRPAVQSSPNTDAPPQRNLSAAEVKDANIYVTLQRIKPTPQPAQSSDSIYVSMRFNRDDTLHPGELPRKRSDLPEEWRTEETAASSAEENTSEEPNAEETNAEEIAASSWASSLPKTDDAIYE